MRRAGGEERGEDKRIKEADTQEERRLNQRRKREGSQEKTGGQAGGEGRKASQRGQEEKGVDSPAHLCGVSRHLTNTRPPDQPQAHSQPHKAGPGAAGQLATVPSPRQPCPRGLEKGQVNDTSTSEKARRRGQPVGCSGRGRSP